MKNLEKYMVLFLAIWSGITCHGQDSSNYAGPLTHPSYFENPKEYLKNLDSNLVENSILLDRVLYSDLLLKNNGTSKVTTIDYSNFYDIYQTLDYADEHAVGLPDFDTLLMRATARTIEEDIHPLIILDFDVKRISTRSVLDGVFQEKDSVLEVTNSSISDFDEQRVVCFSLFSHNIFGNNIKFEVNDYFIFGNRKDLVLESVEVDWGNGAGFQFVAKNEVLSVTYAGPSEFIELRLKLNYLNNSGEPEVVYAHSTTFRKGIENFVEATPEMDNDGSGARIFNPVPHIDLKLFPDKEQYIIREVCDNHYYQKPTCYYEYGDREHDYSLEYSILFNAGNKSNKTKLRRPFIIVDGIDFGNERNYYYTDKRSPKLLEKEKDDRGLYEILDGARGPWHKSGEQAANFIDALRADGYDLVFVNFRNGDGNIFTNAASLKDFLNEIINGSYRDNKTEESILVGPSMGGLITRIALTAMENAGEEHLVKTWICFDSPQRGANIPIGIQEYIEGMSYIMGHSPSGVGTFAGLLSKKLIDDKLGKLDAIATKQLLFYHHQFGSDTKIGSHDNFNIVQQTLDELGFPKYCKNYAVTCGGKELLYEFGDNTIGKRSDWALKTFFTSNSFALKGEDNVQTISEIFARKYFADNVIPVYTSVINGKGTLRIDNSPGSWHTVPYSLNKDPDNLYFDEVEQAGNARFDHATFIPTTSAFGVKLTPENIQNTWEAYTTCDDDASGKIKTPFDGIFGMETNEEHVRISTSTRDSVRFSWLRSDFENYFYPYMRGDEAIHKTSSKKVAYVEQKSSVFAGKGNTFTIKSWAEVNIVAGTSIKFLPGTKIEKNAKVHAIIQSFPTTGSTLRKADRKVVAKDQLWESAPIHNRAYSYQKEQVIVIQNTSWELSSYPNPFDEVLYFSVDQNRTGEQGKVLVLDVTGKKIYEDTFIPGQENSIKTHLWNSGIYILEVILEGVKKQTKIIKY